MRTCTSCKQKLPDGHFSPRARGGLRSECKACRARETARRRLKGMGTDDLRAYKEKHERLAAEARAILTLRATT